MLFEQFKNLLAARKLFFQASDHQNLIVSGVYSGFDPTAKSLHIGNLIPILGLILCGQNRIQPYALVGSATTLIGDPSGRKSAKSILSEAEICKNALLISKQIENIYSKGMEISRSNEFLPVKFVDNLSWFKDMRFIDFLTEFGRYVKVNSMLSRNCVISRINSEDSLNFCEFSYQLMQGYDFLHLFQQFGVNAQIGGSDQWGNMISGTEFIRKKLEKDAAFITLPLLTTANGVKMGKSFGNGVWLDSNLTSIYDFYQYFASLSDGDALHILPILNIFDPEEVYEIINQHKSDPSKHIIQTYLANYMTSLVHGEHMSDQAARLSNTLFSFSNDIDLSGLAFEKLLDSSRLKIISKSKFLDNEIVIFDFLKQIFPEHSNNQLRNMIRSGGIRLNHEKIEDFSFKFRKDELKKYILLNYGKTSFFIAKIEN